MRRWIAVATQAAIFVIAGVLYFYVVLPRTYDLAGDIPHGLATALRIVTGVLVGLAALPVVFTWLSTRKPEFGTPQLALTLRTWSIVAHVLAGVLIAGAAISEIWLNLDTAGPYLFAIYGAAAAIAVLGAGAFYLAYAAEMPPPPPKPLKAKGDKRAGSKGEKKRRDHKSADDAADAAVENEAVENEAVDATPDPEPEATEPARAGLRNRRPSGKGRGSGVALSDD